MPSQSEHYDVAVVGGGVIGLAVAWRAAQRGLRTLVLDAGEDGAWRYAAGMLAPVTEAEFGERRAARRSACARRRLPRLLRRARAASGATRACAAPARSSSPATRDEAEELERLLAYRRELGLAVERLRPSQARRAEPALAPTVRLALDVPGDARGRPAPARRRAGRGGRARRRRDPPRR